MTHGKPVVGMYTLYSGALPLSILICVVLVAPSYAFAFDVDANSICQNALESTPDMKTTMATSGTRILRLYLRIIDTLIKEYNISSSSDYYVSTTTCSRTDHDSSSQQSMRRGT